MRIRNIAIALFCCLFAVALYAQPRKPGLYEVTTTMNWKQSPLPPGMNIPGGRSPFGGAPITSQYCVTQEQLDKYGAPVSHAKECQIVNIVKSYNGMKAEMVCSGHMNGKGSLETWWKEDLTVRSKVHFVGTMQAGQNPMPIEWTSESTSTYKGPNCGNVQPLPTGK